MPEDIYLYGIIWTFLFCMIYCKDKNIYTYEAFTDEDRSIIQNNIAFVRREIQNMPDFRNRFENLSRRIRNIQPRLFNAFNIGNILEISIIRRMEEEVKDAANDGNNLRNRRNRLRRVPNVNISYFKN